MFDSLKKKIKQFSSVFSRKVEEKIAEEPAPKAEPAPAKPQPAKRARPQPAKRARKAPKTAEAAEPESLEPEPLPKLATIQEKIEKQRNLHVEKEAKARHKAGLLTKLRKAVLGSVRLSQSDLDAFLDDLELELLEADVALETAEAIEKYIRQRLSQEDFGRGEDIQKKVYGIFRDAISGILDKNSHFDIADRIKEKPYKIMVLGPNGAGKTTSVAKLVYYLKQKGYSSAISASDTFRAASMEQLGHHAEKLGVKMVRHDYNADPTAVAFDAVNYAKAHGIDVLFIDTAGRQDTNQNLIKQVEKMDRVIKPDLKLFVTEAVVGNAILDQIRAYKGTTGLDGVMLTKVDLDSKGGSVLSIINEGIPLLYLGVGQGYSDIMPFDKGFLLEKMFES